MTKLPTIAVLGANGRLGRAMTHAAHAAGHRVITVTRKEKVDAPAGTEHRVADAMDPAALTRAVNGAEVVFNGLNPPYTQWGASALPMARNVVTACETAGAFHLFPGNVYGFGSTMPEKLNADTPQKADTRKGRIRAEMEDLFKEAAQQGRMRTAILRAGDFFGGPVAGSWFDLMLVSKLSKGRFTYPGPMHAVHAWAYLPDLAAAFVDLARRHADMPAFSTETFAGHAATGAEFKAAVERATGQNLKTAHLPWPVIRAMGLLHPMSREIAELRYLWSVPHTLDGTPSKTPLVEAIATACQDIDASTAGRP